MDARAVTRQIGQVVWPALRQEEFSAFTGRNAWRYVDDAIDVVNFQSFSAGLAGSVGCTTFSFGVNLGVWLPPDTWAGLEPKRDAQGRLRPAEYQCEPHRRALQKSLAQPWFEPFTGNTRDWPPALRLHRKGLQKVMRTDQHDRPDIWFVLPDGSNLDECLEDALWAIREHGLPWLKETRVSSGASDSSARER